MNAIEELKNAFGMIDPSMVPIAHKIVVREGGYVDHPNDPGGATKHGISIRYARTRGTMFDLDGDGDVDKEDIRQVTPDMAAGVFLLDFYMTPRINTMPRIIQPSVFDMAVNAGPATAIKLAQRTANSFRMNDIAALAEDGTFGPRTRQALETAASRFSSQIRQRYAEVRIAHYRSLAANNPKLQVFLNGWQRRAIEASKD